MTRNRPLSGTTVLEFGHIVAGPFCTLLLADLGAEVIKVEHPAGGDAIRDSSPAGNSSFNYVNRDKMSVTIDLKSDAGAAIVRDLVADADVVVENYAPGTAERLGIGYEELRSINPALVYCSIKGFNDGPYREYPALDPVAEGLSGLMSVTGHPGQPPARCGTSIADMAASFYGAISVLGALYQCEHTSEGQKLTVPLFESTVSLMGYWLAYTQAYDEVPEPLGAGHPNWAPYDVYETGDEEWVFIGPSSERQFERLCTALDTDLHERERFATLDDRRANREQLDRELTSVCQEFIAEELIERLREASVPVAPVNDTRDVITDQHLLATDAFTTVATAEGRDTDVRVPRFPVHATGFERINSENPPKLGEDTVAILRALGYDEAHISALRERGVI